MEMLMAHDFNGTRHLFWRRRKELARGLNTKIDSSEISLCCFFGGLGHSRKESQDWHHHISEEKYVKRLVADTVAKFGKLDVLVNNAAFAIFGPFEKTTTEDWRKLMATDLDAVYFACREALPHLLKTKGSIINLSSASGLGGDWGMSSYNAAKGAITNFTRALALEYGSRGVRINAVAPSLTSTEATAEIEKSDAVMAAFRERLPIGRGAKPEEVAGVIAFLASEDAVFVNGVILSVDGGLHASNGQPNFLSLMGQG
jgi:meso-butanediol dehydrogenase / (S,S)-butanediol dehydrogenase / diacetyl reductase